MNIVVFLGCLLVIYIGSSIYYRKNKKHFLILLYSNCMILILIILIVKIIMKLNAYGAFWFIHIINLSLFIYWCVSCNHNKVSNQLLIEANIVFPSFYMFLHN